MEACHWLLVSKMVSKTSVGFCNFLLVLCCCNRKQYGEDSVLNSRFIGFYWKGGKKISKWPKQRVAFLTAPMKKNRQNSVATKTSTALAAAACFI